LENHPLAKAQHKLFAIDLRMRDDPGQRDALVARAIADWKDADPSQLTTLAGWLNAKGEFQRELDAIPLEKALQNRDLFLQHVDALGALGRWDEITSLLNAERFPLEPVVQLMYLARSNAQLGEKTASENNWQRALEAAQADPPKLLMLADYAEKNGALQIAESAYDSAANAFPKSRPAQQGRLRLAQAGGNTGKIHAVLADMLRIWPNDSAIQNDEAYLRLLLAEQTKVESGKEKVENGKESEENDAVAAIERLAADLVKREPASLPHRTLLALARLRQNRPAGALEVYTDLNVPKTSVSPSALAVHAAVLAANGNMADARSEAAQVPVDRLLPEERGLIAALLQ
jgi:tetratricopeptide (TPR) repeat protein